MTPQMRDMMAAVRLLSADGVPPTIRQLAAHLGLASVSGAHRRLCLLRDRGLIEWTPGQAHSIRVVEEHLDPARLARLSTRELMTGAAAITRILADRAAP